MEPETPKRRRIRLWPALVVLLVLVVIGLALPIYEGKRHQRIAAELEAGGVNVLLSHYAGVPVSGPSGTYFEYQSILPGFMEQTGLSLAVRRIRKVTMGTSQIPAASPLLRQIGELDKLQFYDNSGVTASQLESLLSDVQVQRLLIPMAKLPPTGLEWLNREGLTQLGVFRTNFSNPAIDDLPESLEWFNAGETLINDDGLDAFVRLKHLYWLNLSGTPTSEAAIEDLRKKMPWCEIKWEPPVAP